MAKFNSDCNNSPVHYSIESRLYVVRSGGPVVLIAAATNTMGDSPAPPRSARPAAPRVNNDRQVRPEIKLVPHTAQKKGVENKSEPRLSFV